MRHEPAERAINYVREGRKMPFTPPKPEDLKAYSAAGINDLRTHAETELTALRASVTPDTVTDEQLDQMEGLKSFIAAADTEVEDRRKRAERFDATDVPAKVEPEPIVADATPAHDDNGDKDVSATVAAVDIANTATEVVEATVTAAGATSTQGRRSVQVADIAAHAPAPEIPQGNDTPGYTIVAAADIANTPTGTQLDWSGVGVAFEERVRAYPSAGRSVGKARMQHPLARIRRDFPDTQVVFENDGHEVAFNKLRDTADAYVRGEDAVVAANGWCAPSEPDYSICSPVSSDGLWNGPEQILRRGGLIHNRGLDFGDFFGDDFVLPIPGYNILTEAQVIADTAKTCVEIPCPAFVDDRLNVAALCLTSSLLQNRGYPEFVAEFTRCAVAATAHLVIRGLISALATGSPAVVLTAVDPWATDGTFYSNMLSAVEFAIKDMRYISRAPMSTRFDVVLPYWVLGAMRADYIRQNARVSDDLADATIMARFSERGANVQFVYDWQDAFNPGAIPATNQMGNATAPFNYPTLTQFLVYLPGTWVLGRQDVIRLDTVYDSTNLQQNLVTQLFMEDGFIPMRMCQHSRLYTINICANGSTGVQRAVTCTDVTP